MGVVALLCKEIEDPLEQEVGSRDPNEKRGVEGPEGPPGKIGKMGPVGSRGGIGARGEKGEKEDTGGVCQQGPIGSQGSTGPRGVQGAKALRGVAGIQGPLGVQGPIGSTGGQKQRGLKGDKCIQGSVGAKGHPGERGERGEKGEKGIQSDNPDVLSVLADHLPIQLATRYSEKMCFIKYHKSEDRSSIIELSGGVGTLRNVSAYHEPACHFDARFVDGQGHEMANVQKATGYGHFLEMKNYDLANNKVNTIYIVYKMRKYDSTGIEHNYLDNHRGICFLKDEKTMRVYDAVGDQKPDYMDISNFLTSYYNPCRKDRWNVACV